MVRSYLSTESLMGRQISIGLYDSVSAVFLFCSSFFHSHVRVRDRQLEEGGGTVFLFRLVCQITVFDKFVG